jgi:hypothetical protein
MMLTLLEAPSRLATPEQPIGCSCFVCSEVGGANPEPLMSALGHKRTLKWLDLMSVLFPKAVNQTCSAFEMSSVRQIYSGCSRASVSSHEFANIESADWAMQTFQVKLAERLDLCH